MQFKIFEFIPFYVSIRNIIYQKYLDFIKNFFPKKNANILFKQTFGYSINWDNPRDLNEIINYLAFNTDTTQWSQLSDKYAVRSYVKDKGCEEILIPLLGHWDTASDVDFNSLPNQFVLKSNHGSGDAIIVKNKKSANLESIRQEASIALNNNFGLDTAEPHYLKIHPCIIAEKYLEPSKGEIIDYKVWCFNGKPYYIFTVSNRNHISHKANYAIFDLDWNRHDEFITEPFKNNIVVEKPKHLIEMLDYAKILSHNFPQVRVDFYEIDEKKIYFGEMTFSSQCGRMDYFTSEFLAYLGTKIIFNQKNF